MLGSIVWSCCGRRAVGLQSGLCWSPCGNQPCSASAGRPHSALYRQTKFSIGTDQLFNWTLDRLICSVTNRARRSPQRGKSSVAEHSAKLNPSKPAAQMFLLIRLTDGSIFCNQRSWCVFFNILWYYSSKSPTNICNNHFVIFFWLKQHHIIL